MKALKIEPGKAPERIDIHNELETLQDAVGGYIQVVYPDPHRLTTSLLARSSWWESMKRTSRICEKKMQHILRSCSIRRRSLSTSQGGWSSPRWFLAGLNGPAFFKTRKTHSVFWVLFGFFGFDGFCEMQNKR